MLNEAATLDNNAGASSRGIDEPADELRNPYCFVNEDPVTDVDYLGLTCKTAGKCLCCMVFAESRGTPSPCQKAIAWVIKNRSSTDKDYCAVVSEPGQFNGYGTASYDNCCDDCVPAKEKTEFDTAINSCTSAFTGADPTAGATYFHDKSISTPDWIKKKIVKGKAKEVSVTECAKFRFYKVW